MTPERWEQVNRLFHAALEHEPGRRSSFIAQVCGGDEPLRSEVESLIVSHERAESFIETPASDIAAELLAGGQDKLAVGQTIGRYEIVTLLGSGGMGEVYLAQDRSLGRQIALKLLPPQFTINADRVRRFEREARAASALNHPNIVTIHEIGHADSTHFIATEFIDGVTLRERMAGRPLKLDEALDFATQVASALAAAHAAGIVHRDIKPENVMLRSDGFVKVLDFGLAKLAPRQASTVDAEAPTKSMVRTNPGMVMGTVQYMSPEQARGREVDARSDIWSLGVVVYEMVTGRVPFAGETPSHVIVSIMESEPPALAIFLEVPAELERIVTKALRKNREERYQTASDLVLQLKSLKRRLEFEVEQERTLTPEESKATTNAGPQASASRAAGRHADFAPQTSRAGRSTNLSGEIVPLIGREQEVGRTALAATNGLKPLSAPSVITSAKPRARKLFWLTAVLSIVVLAGIGFASYQLANRSPMKFEAKNISRITSNGKVKTAVVSSDGRFVIYVQEENNEQQSLWMQHVGSESSVQIAPAARIEYHALNISPDGNYLYSIDAQGSLYRMAVLGGTVLKVSDGLNGYFSFSPDGKQIAFVRNTEKRTTALLIANADGTNERRLASFEQPIRLGWYSAWSPDGKVIACWFINAGKQNILAIQVADGTSAPVLPQGWTSVGNMTWMPDSESLLVFGIKDDSALDLHQVWQVSYSSGEARQITNDTNNYESTNLTSDGSFLAAVRTELIAHIWTMPGDAASRTQQLTAGFEKSDGRYFLSWMPDGKIVYDSVPSGKLLVWAMEADGSNPRQLAKDVGALSISPDGRYLVYQKGEVDESGLWRMDLNDGSEEQLTKGVDVWATFSPDGKWVVYTGYGERTALWKVPVEGGEPTQVLVESATCPAVSPDGKIIAFVLRKAVEKIALVSFDGGEITKTFDIKPELVGISDKQNLQWTSDGRAVNYIALNNGVSNIWRQPIDGSPPFQVTNFETGRIFNFAFSPDGKQLALSRGTLNSDVVLIKNSE